MMILNSRQILTILRNIKRYLPLRHIAINHIVIEITNKCNASCIFCPPTGGKTMSWAIFTNIVDLCVAEGIKNISFGGHGEPFMDTNFFDKAAYIRDKGITFHSVTTNASLLDESKFDSLHNTKLQFLGISIDTLDPIKYKTTRLGLKFKTVTQNIKNFLEDNQKRNNPIRIIINRIPLWPEPEFHKWFEGFNNIKIATVPLHNWGGQMDKHYSSNIHGACNRIFRPHVAILVDGKMSICCMDYKNIHSPGLVTNNITELWNSPAMKKIRKYHIWGRWNKLALCKNCSEICLGNKTMV